MLNLAQQKYITKFLESPIKNVKNAVIPDGLKILAFQAMTGESSLVTEEQLQLLSESGLNVYIKLVTDLSTYFGVSENPLNSFWP